MLAGIRCVGAGGLAFCLFTLAVPGGAHAGNNDISATDVSAILARPLFESDRRPKGAVAQAEDVLQVVGISGRDGAWRAILQIGADGQGGQRGRIVPKGGRVDGWTVLDIDATTVTLRRGGTMMRLGPVFQKYHPAGGNPAGDRNPASGAPVSVASSGEQPAGRVRPGVPSHLQLGSGEP